jgi:hypothetical protein
MNFQEKIDKILSIGERITDKKNLKPEEIDLIVKTYKEYKGIALRVGCGACLIDAYFEFKLITPETIARMMTRKYRMIKGRGIDLYYNEILPAGYWTDANITDEVAVKLIKAGYGKFFIGNPKPEDVEELEDEVPPVVPPVVVPPVLDGSEISTDESKTEEEVLLTEEDQKEEATKEERSIADMTKQELKTLATVRNFPKDEWSNLNRAELEAYLQSRI